MFNLRDSYFIIIYTQRILEIELLTGVIMNSTHTIDEEAFSIIGIALRTTNKAAIENGTIAQLWQRFMSESVYVLIPNKIDTCVIALYYDFESDKNGEYTLLVGAKVSTLDELPAGMVGKHVLAEKRIVFTSVPGPQNTIVFDLWNKIWILEDQHAISRSYTADYELYNNRSNNPQNAIMEIHIGI
jgi:predicted transcriptional regulator YdeE